MNDRSSHNTLGALAATCLLLAGCSTPEGYPDLQIRDVERVTGSMDAPARQDYVPTPVAPATLAQLDSLVTAARAAHTRFTARAPDARRAAERARGSGVGSENWSVAQVAVADLEGIRSAAMIAIADIDRIYVNAATGGDDIARIEAARSEVDAMIGEEDRTIANLLETIGR